MLNLAKNSTCVIISFALKNGDIGLKQKMSRDFPNTWRTKLSPVSNVQLELSIQPLALDQGDGYEKELWKSSRKMIFLNPGPQIVLDSQNFEK